MLQALKIITLVLILNSTTMATETEKNPSIKKRDVSSNDEGHGLEFTSISGGLNRIVDTTNGVVCFSFSKNNSSTAISCVKLDKN